MEQVAIKDLQLGDIIELGHDHFGFTASTVTRVHPEWVELTRPYIHIGNFKLGSSDGSKYVIDYFGVEKYKLLTSDTRPVYLAIPYAESGEELK